MLWPASEFFGTADQRPDNKNLNPAFQAVFDGAPFPSAGQFVYSSDVDIDTVSIVDAKSRTKTAEIPVGKEPLGVVTSVDGSKLFVANFRSNTVSVIDVRRDRIIKEIQIHDNPRTMAITADGEKLYVTHFLDGVISVIDTKEL